MSIEVIVKGTEPRDIQAAIKKFSSLVKKNEIIEEVYSRREFVKPSKKRKLKQEKAKIKKIRQEKMEAKRNRNLNNI